MLWSFLLGQLMSHILAIVYTLVEFHYTSTSSESQCLYSFLSSIMKISISGSFFLDLPE
jgi:hypothetical protein